MRFLTSALNSIGSALGWTLLIAIGAHVVRTESLDRIAPEWVLAALIAVGMIVVTYLHRFLAWSGKGVRLAGLVSSGFGVGGLLLFHSRVDRNVIAFLVVGGTVEAALAIDAALLRRRAQRAAIPRFDRVAASTVIFASLPFAAGALGACLGHAKIGVPYVVWLVGASVIGFRLVIVDKLRAAESRGRGAMRVRENTLHLIEFLGGWPGSLVAQYGVRHKTTKRSYRVKFGGMVLAHIACVAVISLWLR